MPYLSLGKMTLVEPTKETIRCPSARHFLALGEAIFYTFRLRLSNRHLELGVSSVASTMVTLLLLKLVRVALLLLRHVVALANSHAIRPLAMVKRFSRLEASKHG